MKQALKNNLDDIIVSKPSILGGTPVFEGTRIPASLVNDLLNKGYSADLIAKEYPSLSKTDLTTYIHAQA
jgi:uncharacterized protein (DUF433 family)